MGVGCGELHSLAVDDLGNVYAWGRNREGQCGQGTLTVAVPAPQRVTALAHERIVKARRRRQPFRVGVRGLTCLFAAAWTPARSAVPQVAAGSHQSMAITEDGRLFRFGLFHQKVGGRAAGCGIPAT